MGPGDLAAEREGGSCQVAHHLLYDRFWGFAQAGRLQRLDPVLPLSTVMLPVPSQQSASNSEVAQAKWDWHTARRC